MGEQQDAPNQQNVRPDASGPGDEGSGGSERREREQAQTPPQGPREGEQQQKSLDDMTKDELLAEAQRRGVEADQNMTKSDIRAAIDSG